MFEQIDHALVAPSKRSILPAAEGCTEVEPDEDPKDNESAEKDRGKPKGEPE
jgi:hypothetical protein